MALGTKITAANLIEIKSDVTLDELKTCFLSGISSAENPFTTGMALSVAIETAVRMLPERERRTLSDLQDKLDELLLEVLERLPQSIQRLPGGLEGCVALFEPETAMVRGIVGHAGLSEPNSRVELGKPEAPGARTAEFRGPLKLALQERQFTETICVSPLLFEYLSHKFVSGLPIPSDSEDHISATYEACRREAFCSEDAGMVSESAMGRLMQGLRLTSHGSLGKSRDWEKLLHSTVYPGAQFVAVGVVTRPMAFYKVNTSTVGVEAYATVASGPNYNEVPHSRGDLGYGIAGAPIFTIGFEPQARSTMYLTIKTRFRSIYSRSVANRILLIRIAKVNHRKIKPVSEQGRHSRE